jgi:hypothetical protein
LIVGRDYGCSKHAREAVSRASDGFFGLKRMMIDANLRRSSCFVNFNVVLIASMFVLDAQIFA